MDTETQNGFGVALTELIKTAPVIATEKQLATAYLKQYSGLKIVDTETYKTAKIIASDIRTRRLEMDKRFTGATSALKLLLKTYSDQANDLLLTYKAGEQEIRAEIKRVDDEKQAEKERIEREAAERFMQRTETLFDAGYTFNGYLYSVGTIFLDSGKIEDMADEDFAAMVEQGRLEASRISEVLAASQVKDAVDVVIMTEPEPVEDFPVPPPVVAKPTQDLSWWAPVDENPIQEDFIQKPEPPVVQTDFRPAGFTAGYDACKADVLAILASPEKFTRQALIDLIANLKP
jgi:hypothetical protein